MRMLPQGWLDEGAESDDSDDWEDDLAELIMRGHDTT